MTSAQSRRFALSAMVLAVCAGSGAAQAMSLTEALHRAAQHDPAVAQSLALYDADREAGTQSRASRRPTLTANGAYTRYDVESESQNPFAPAVDETYPAWRAAVELRQPLFRLDWFAIGDRAEAQDAMADASLYERRLQLLTRVADRYFTVLIAQDNLQQAQAEAEAVRKSLDDTRKRYEVELVPGTDLKEAQSRDDLARAQLLVAERELEAARDALDETTGNGRAVLPQLPRATQFPALTPQDPEAWIKAAREQNPALITAAQELRLATANVRSRQATVSPTLDAVGRYGRDDSLESIYGQRIDQGSIGVELTIPIYAGGLGSSLVREARARERAAQANVQRLTFETERQARQLYRQVQTGYAEISAREQALVSAAAAEQAITYGYDAGTRTIADVLDAKSRVAQVRRELNQTRYTLLLSLLQLRQVAGTLSEQDFMQIDQLLNAANAASE